MNRITIGLVSIALLGAGLALADEGEALYQQSCSPCHGPDAKGVPTLGRDLTTSEFLRDKSEDELVEFVNTGRPLGDPRNQASIPMPPKGGNPGLTDEQTRKILQYLRSLEGS